MSKEEAQQPPKREAKYLLARSRNNRGFNRGGLRFEAEWQAWPVTSIERAKLETILKEPMLDAHIVSESEAAKYETVKHAVLDENTPRAEILTYVQTLERRLVQYEERVAKLEAKNAAPLPPKPGYLPNGEKIQG